MSSAFGGSSTLFALIGLLVFEKLNQRRNSDLVFALSTSIILLIHRSRLRYGIRQALQEVYKLLILIDRALPSILAYSTIWESAIWCKFNGWRAKQRRVF